MKRIDVHLLRTSWLMVWLVFCPWTVAYTETAVPGPTLVINEQSFDFEEVKEGSVVEHSFQVLNTGDQVLKIKRVKPA